MSLQGYNNATERRNLFNQTDVTGTLATGAVRHTLLAGAELSRQRTDNVRNTAYFNGSATSTSTPVPFATPTSRVNVAFRQSATDADNHVQADVGALYAQDQIALSSRWQAIAGVRVDAFTVRFHNNRNGQDLERYDRLVSPRAGLIFKPVDARLALRLVQRLPSPELGRPVLLAHGDDADARARAVPQLRGRRQVGRSRVARAHRRAVPARSQQQHRARPGEPDAHRADGGAAHHGLRARRHGCGDVGLAARRRLLVADRAHPEPHVGRPRGRERAARPAVHRLAVEPGPALARHRRRRRCRAPGANVRRDRQLRHAPRLHPLRWRAVRRAAVQDAGAAQRREPARTRATTRPRRATTTSCRVRRGR